MSTRRELLLVVAGVAVGAVAPVFAHLGVRKSEPANKSTIASSPERITIWFNQAPALAVSSFALEGPKGAVKLGDVAAGEEQSLTAAVLEPLQAGPHTLTWKTAGNDGHVITGTRVFTYAPTR